MYTIKSREGLIETVYDCIRNNTPLDTVHIPHSDVFFVREALEARFDCELSLLQVEEYMKEAGWTDGGNSRKSEVTDGEEWSLRSEQAKADTEASD